MQHRVGVVQLGSGVVLFSALMMGVLAWSGSGAPSDELRRRMSGSFVLDEPESDIEVRLGEAVEHVVARLGSHVQGVARAQLSRVVAYCRQYDLDIGMDSVRVECEESGSEDAPVTQSRIGSAAGAGVRAVFHEDALVLSSESADGAETTTYRLAEGGGLEVDVRMTSQQLERPLAWKVRYRRVPTDSTPSAARVAVSLSER